MAMLLQNEITKLKKKLLALSSIVEGSVEKAIRSVAERNVALAKEVIENDESIDAEEVCIRIGRRARYQETPFAAAHVNLKRLIRGEVGRNRKSLKPVFRLNHGRFSKHVPVTLRSFATERHGASLATEQAPKE